MNRMLIKKFYRKLKNVEKIFCNCLKIIMIKLIIIFMSQKIYKNLKYIQLTLLMNKIVKINSYKLIKIKIILKNINNNKLKSKMIINKYLKFKCEILYLYKILFNFFFIIKLEFKL